jgi:hypothetical protein
LIYAEKLRPFYCWKRIAILSAATFLLRRSEELRTTENGLAHRKPTTGTSPRGHEVFPYGRKEWRAGVNEVRRHAQIAFLADRASGEPVGERSIILF